MTEKNEKGFLEKIRDIAAWVGTNLTTMLTIFSIVIAALFLRERKKNQLLETDAELDEKKDAVDAAKEKVDEASKNVEDSGKAYDDAFDVYKRNLPRR